jgi:hypothetical protein
MILPVARILPQHTIDYFSFTPIANTGETLAIGYNVDTLPRSYLRLTPNAEKQLLEYLKAKYKV